MTAALLRRFLLGGVSLGGVHGIEGPATTSLVERCFILRIDDCVSRRRGAVESRRSMCVDGLAQEDRAVWLRGGVDGRPGKVVASVSALKMDRWMTAAADSESAPDWCVPQTGYMAWLGPPVLDVRLRCVVCLVLGSDYRHPCIRRIGVATVVAKMVTSDYLMYYFVRSL